MHILKITAVLGVAALLSACNQEPMTPEQRAMAYGVAMSQLNHSFYQNPMPTNYAKQNTSFVCQQVGNYTYCN